jgi:hypothetical protein
MPLPSSHRYCILVVKKVIEVDRVSVTLEIMVSIRRICHATERSVFIGSDRSIRVSRDCAEPLGVLLVQYTWFKRIPFLWVYSVEQMANRSCWPTFHTSLSCRKCIGSLQFWMTHLYWIWRDEIDVMFRSKQPNASCEAIIWHTTFNKHDNNGYNCTASIR